jgi:glycosyltransferase involved in cell wall biosynthesis
VWRTLAWFFSYLTTLLSHAVIVVSAHDRDGARMWGMHSKIHLVHTALSPITFETREDARAALFSPELILRHQSDTWLVALSEFNRNKNLGILIEAVAELKRRGITNVFLTLISDGELRPHLEALVQLHELNDHVYFTGFVPEARTFLKAFDIFVMPSLKEGFPYVLLEAGAAKLPVIASNVGGIPELIRDGVTGLLIDPHHPHTLVDALTALITRTYPRDLPPSITLGEALENEVERAYTLPLMLNRTRFVYENGSRAL